MKTRIGPAFLAALLILCLACSSSDNPGNDTGAGNNYLRLKIDGKDWIANSEIFGAFHPPGYNKALLMAGSLGPNNKDEQSFNLNLYNISGPGVYHIQTGNPELSEAQLANLSPEHYLYGNVLGFDMKVTVTKASSDPTIIEASFEGSLTGNAGDVIQISEGRFYYHE